ncbi:MAG: hypothetical protein L6Q77_08645 [Bacteroidetes bacterium]|nr:hypothetical protein [Bacteroidota bacterium]
MNLFRFSSLNIVSVLVFAGVISFWSDSTAQPDYARIYRRFFENKTVITGDNRLVFNQKIERLGKVNPYLIPGYIRLLNKYQNTQENPDYQAFDRIRRIYEAKFNRDLRRELDDLEADETIPSIKKWTVARDIKNIMVIEIPGSPGDTATLNPEPGDAFKVALFLSKNSELAENSWTDYQKMVDSLGKESITKTILGFRAAKADPTFESDQIIASWTNSWFWRNQKNLQENDLPERLYRLLSQRESGADYFNWLKSNTILRKIDPGSYHLTFSLSFGPGFLSDADLGTYTQDFIAVTRVTPFKAEHRESNYMGYTQLCLRWTDSDYPLNSLNFVVFGSAKNSPLSHAETWKEVYSSVGSGQYRDDYNYSFQCTNASASWKTFSWGIFLPAYSWKGVSAEAGFIQTRSSVTYKGQLSYTLLLQRVEIETGRVVINYTPYKNETKFEEKVSTSETRFAYRIQWKTPWFLETAITGTSGFWTATAGIRLSTN